jgi:mannose-6-phosphate isomerase
MDGELIPLNRAIERFPEGILGERIAGAFGGRLPFLFKVLAAASPLSIQAHPDRYQAEEGFRAENLANIPLDAPNRNYRDSNHKPECICALTPFWGLCGFRDISEISIFLDRLCPRTLEAEIGMVREERPSAAIRRLYRNLLTFSEERQHAVLEEALSNAAIRTDENPVFRWIVALHRTDRNDISVISPAFMNLFCLEPGQALFLPAGELHAYLDGVGIELMANSDNVLRGGLTSKHIDVGELLKILNFEPRPLEVITAERVSEHERAYSTGVREFLLSVISVREPPEGIPVVKNGVEILLCTDGNIRIFVADTGQRLTMARGTSVLIPAGIDRYALHGRGKIYKASVPR